MRSEFCRYGVIGNITDSQSVEMMGSNPSSDTNLGHSIG